MIKYVQNKVINYDRVKELLKKSEQAHTYTNNGPVKQILEKELENLFKFNPKTKSFDARFFGRRVVCTSSGTAALYALVSLFEKRACKPLKWVTGAFTFPAATVNKLQTAIIDVDPTTGAIPLNQLAEFDGVITTTLFGTTTGLKELSEYCANANKILIVDNASSPLSTLDNININCYGNATIGSLHHTKYLGHSEAGFAVVPADLYDEFSQLTNFGFNDDRKYLNLATNAKMSDVVAAFVLTHIETYSLLKHCDLQNEYFERIKTVTNVKILNWDTGVMYGNMPIVFTNPTSHLSFRDINIETNKYYKPLLPLPNSMHLFDRIINLPLHAGLDSYDLDLIFKKIEVEAKK